MGKSQSISLSHVCVGRWTEFVFVEEKRRVRTEDLSQMAAESTNGTRRRDRQKTMGGRAMGEQDSRENCVEGR